MMENITGLFSGYRADRGDEVGLGDKVIIMKGWGYEQWIVNKKEYCGKLLFFKAGKECSYHYHLEKDETFFLQSGKMIVRYGQTDKLEESQKQLLLPGDRFYVPPGLRHSMEALTDCELFEFSTQHFESDSYIVKKGDVYDLRLHKK